MDSTHGHNQLDDRGEAGRQEFPRLGRVTG